MWMYWMGILVGLYGSSWMGWVAMNGISWCVWVVCGYGGDGWGYGI